MKKLEELMREVQTSLLNLRGSETLQAGLNQDNEVILVDHGEVIVMAHDTFKSVNELIDVQLAESSLRDEKTYIITMIENTDLQEFANQWDNELIVNRLIGYTELPPNHRMALIGQVSMLFGLTLVDLEDEDIRHIVLKRLRNK